MHKGLLVFIVVASIGFTYLVIIFMIDSADESRKKSDKILDEFKRINKRLKRSNRAVDSLNTGTATFDSGYKKIDNL